MYPDPQQALESIDRFIGVAEIANLPILKMPEYRPSVSVAMRKSPCVARSRSPLVAS
jgi:hypothetical protein